MSAEAVAFHFKADPPRISIQQASGEGSTSSIGEHQASLIKLQSLELVGYTDHQTICDWIGYSTEFGLQTSLIKLQYSKAAGSTKAFFEDYSDSETIFEPGPLKDGDSAKFDCFDENVSLSSSKKQGYKILQLPKAPTQKSLSKTLQIANEDLKPDSADALSASLLQAMMMFDEEKYARGFLLVKDALPDSISAADVHKLGKELEEDCPVCAIILHHVSCVHHNSEAPSPENTSSWINDRIADIDNIAGTAMNYECDEGSGHSIITCCLKAIEDLLFKIPLDSPNTDIAGDDLKLSDNLQKLSIDGRQEAILFPLRESVDSPDAIICESTHENDSDPPYGEEGEAKLGDPSQKAPLESISVEPLICAANCFELSILAKQSNDADLQRLVNDYVTKNLKIIATSESLISLSMSDFMKYLESCGLPDTAKLDLVEAKFLLSVNIETTDGSQLKGVDLELARLAAGLSTNYRIKYQTLTTYCHLLLKRHLSDSNCLETAIFAKSCRLDELKVWAEYHVIVNFQSVLANVSTAAYSKEEVTKFCEICSIPDEMRDMLMGQSGPRYEQPEIQKIASKWLLSELRKLSSVKTKTIGVEGGIIELDGCCVNFPKDALSQDTYITLTINTDPKNYPENTLAITPIIDIKPSMSLKQPASVTLKTCFVASSGQTITAQLFTSHGSVWEESPITINLCSEPEIIFRVDHFSGLLVGVPTTSDGKYIFYNDLYIQHESGLISSCFYYHDKDGRDKRKDMRARNCSCFSPTSLRIIGHADEKIKLSVTLEKPEVESLARKRWLPVYKTIKDVLIQTEFTLDPGDPVSSLEVGSFVSGIYDVFIGSESEPQYSAYVKRKWPVTLDPEHTSHNVTANVYNESGGKVNAEYKDSKLMIADGYKDE